MRLSSIGRTRQSVPEAQLGATGQNCTGSHEATTLHPWWPSSILEARCTSLSVPLLLNLVWGREERKETENPSLAHG